MKDSRKQSTVLDRSVENRENRENKEHNVVEYSGGKWGREDSRADRRLLANVPCLPYTSRSNPLSALPVLISG